MLSRVASAMALSLDFSPLLSSILPSIVVMLISIVLLLQKSFS
jgi:lipopolysaccharide export LptBFGC system permease protein LptF